MKWANRSGVGALVAVWALVIAVTAPSARAQQVAAPAAAAGQAGPAGRGGRGGAGGGAGAAAVYPQHVQADQASIDRGKAIFGANCSFCHGADARGGSGGPNLLRSQLVLNDQNGEAIAAVVQNGRPNLGMPKFDLSGEQVGDIAAFIHSFRVTSRDNGRSVPPNIVVGDAKAGELFFNGAGKCSTCHSATGDLSGIAGKMDPKALQNAIVSGGAGGRGGGVIPVPPTTVSVTSSNGKSVTGKLDHLDDFLVSLTDADGNHLSFERNGQVPTVVVHNPTQAHLDMLSQYTDDEIHNLTAYLVTLK